MSLGLLVASVSAFEELAKLKSENLAGIRESAAVAHVFMSGNDTLKPLQEVNYLQDKLRSCLDQLREPAQLISVEYENLDPESHKMTSEFKEIGLLSLTLRSCLRTLSKIDQISSTYHKTLTPVFKKFGNISHEIENYAVDNTSIYFLIEFTRSGISAPEDYDETDPDLELLWEALYLAGYLRDLALFTDAVGIYLSLNRLELQLHAVILEPEQLLPTFLSSLTEFSQIILQNNHRTSIFQKNAVIFSKKYLKCLLNITYYLATVTSDEDVLILSLLEAFE
jgi:hypothetical protein